MLPKSVIEYLYLPGHVGEELPLPGKQGEVHQRWVSSEISSHKCLLFNRPSTFDAGAP